MNKKGKILKTVATIKGTLYENDIVFIEQSENDHYRVVNDMGKIFYVDKDNVNLIEESA